MSVVSFDLDGTLLACREPRSRSFERVRSALDASVPIPSVEAYQSAFRTELADRLPGVAHDGPVRRAALDRAFVAAGADVPETTVTAFADAYRRRRLDRLEPIAGALDLLDLLESPVVVTNGPAGLQRGKLRRTGLSPHVDAVAVAGRCGVRKPAPELFGIAFERVNATTPGGVHVGDARPDVDGALAAGLDPIVLRTDGSSPAWVPDDVPVCGSLEGVRRVLEARGVEYKNGSADRF